MKFSWHSEISGYLLLHYIEVKPPRTRKMLCMQFVVYEEFFQAVQPVNQSGFKYG